MVMPTRKPIQRSPLPPSTSHRSTPPSTQQVVAHLPLGPETLSRQSTKFTCKTSLSGSMSVAPCSANSESTDTLSKTDDPVTKLAMPCCFASCNTEAYTALATECTTGTDGSIQVTTTEPIVHSSASPLSDQDTGIATTLAPDVSFTCVDTDDAIVHRDDTAVVHVDIDATADPHELDAERGDVVAA